MKTDITDFPGKTKKNNLCLHTEEDHFFLKKKIQIYFFTQTFIFKNCILGLQKPIILEN